MAMVDYPYATSFIEPLPANPVNASCAAAATAAATYLNNPNVDLYAIEAAGKVFYNYEDQLECLDLTTSEQGDIGYDGWNVLYCNEMVMPFASDATTSMFPAESWDPAQITTDCQTEYDLTPQLYWTLSYYGGMVPVKDFAKASNIIFSNGTLDPWKAGGVVTEVSSKTTVLMIEGAAHHLDLRLPNEADP
jgi:hypothetical protein